MTYTHTHTHSVGLLWTRDRPSQATYNTKKETEIHAGFEPAILASEWPQTYALVRVATDIVGLGVLRVLKKELRL
jgi:hypothetical protein